MDIIKEVMNIGFKKTFVDLMMILVAAKYLGEIIDYYRYKHKGIASKKSQLGSYMKKADYHDKQIKEMNQHAQHTDDQIMELKAIIQMNSEKADRQTVAINREKLWRMHEEFTSRPTPYVTENELKIFDEIGKVYEEAGGDDIYHDKLHPDIMKLPIKYD